MPWLAPAKTFVKGVATTHSRVEYRDPMRFLLRWDFHNFVPFHLKAGVVHWTIEAKDWSWVKAQEYSS
jgi:hypothetical protein